MEVRVTTLGRYFCDQGPHEGMMRLDLHGCIYLTDSEWEKYARNGLIITFATEDDKNKADIW
jgi:hypothetical protein